jgi:dTDP-4-dehydrorhamnose 3,5-epimerase
MKFTAMSITGAWRIDLEPRTDHRGFFARVFCVDEFAAHNLDTDFLQANTARSIQRGTLRGVHYQRGADAEVKLVRCTQGVVYDVLVDLRPSSPTFRRWAALELSADSGTMLYIPRGCAHGYQTLTDNAELWYGTTARFAPAAATGVRYDDAAFAIDWPLPVSIISDADAKWPDFVVSGEKECRQTC